MTEEFIDLRRRFRPATEDGARVSRGLFDSKFKPDRTWPDLHEKRRVIILAEAGSGKSSEFRGQVRAIRAEGKFAFFVTVRDVAQTGLEAALPAAERSRFAEWRADPEAECWLFIDSVDEAKDQGHHFDNAARNLENAIAGFEFRVHLYISSRFTDWDKTADRRSMEKWLALPQPTPPPPDVGEEVRATLHQRKKPDADPVEDIAVLVLEPLTSDQVAKFAEGSGVRDVAALLEAIEQGNLWSFAARPLDLGWIVDYWQTNKRLGSLREMIEESIRARLLDPDALRRRKDPLDADSAGRALDRIGASFLFCGKDSLRVPAAGVDLAPAEQSIPIELALPDWSDSHRLVLLGRPVFDPATLGRTRLHNDNEGTLRSYLTARWLTRRLEAACPLQTIFDLLFADLYGYRLVRPDMVETSAWLAGQVPAIADELISRSPFNLLRHGDPGSLPIPTRVKAFEGAIAQVGEIDPQKLWFLDEPIRRFAHPALNSFFPDWWNKAKHEEARHLLLRLIHLGRQQGGLEIVRTVAFDENSDEISQLIAVRALIALGTPADRARYAEHLLAHYTDLSRLVVLQALDLLFPQHISIDQFFTLIDAIGVTGADGEASILPIGPEVPESLCTPADLECFLTNIVARSGSLTGEQEDHPFRGAFSELAVAVALRLLETHPDVIPDVVTDLVLLLQEGGRQLSTVGMSKALTAAFGASTGRRRTSFWRSVERLRDHPWLRDSEDVNVWMVQHLGWPVIADASDIDWLIADIRERTDPRDRRTALQAAHGLWLQLSNDPVVLGRLNDAAQIDPALVKQLERWQSPRSEPPELVEQTKHLDEVRRRNAQQEAERDQSWVDLISNLRADPSFFDNLLPQTEETVDSRLFHLWQFLSWRTDSRSRHSIDNLDAVAPIFGPELTRRFGRALIDFAYARVPSSSLSASAEARSVTNFDVMALAGMSLAASTIPGWVDKIDTARADQAAQLAMIELNGFPDYLSSLAKAHPESVRKVLMSAVEGQLSRANPEAHGVLDRLEYADKALARLLAADLERYLEEQPAMPQAMLEKIVSVLVRAVPPVQPGLLELAQQRVREAGDPAEAAHYMLLLFGLEGDSAVDALSEKMASLDAEGQSVLCCTLLPRLFGDRIRRSIKPPVPLSVDRLVQLLIIAFEGVRPGEDIHRPSGKVYSPGQRDAAQGAREMIFDQILKTPGEAAHAALLRLATIPDFPIRPEWLRAHAFRHAEADAELAPWLPEDVLTFERSFGRPPTTTADLQLLARRRIEAIQHDLINGRFAQGDTLQGLVDENAVQRWLATQFEVRQAESYTVQRETHYADEKEPDITLVSRHSGVELPIEVKVVDDLAVAQLEAALETQLCGQYLRHSSTRHGVLLLVHQEARPKGWTLTAGNPPVPFGVVVGHLEKLATAIRERSSTGPQPIVVAIDVSRVVPLQKKRRDKRARKKGA